MSTPTPDGLCRCGCGGKTNIAKQSRTDRGWVRGRPKPYIANHHRRSHPHEYEERDCGYRSPCWVWLRALVPNGYGLHWRDGRKIHAHRAYYEDRFGEVPEGMVLDHLCRNRACVNPEHMQPVTDAINAQRGVKPKLNWRLVREMRAAAQAGESARDLARRFNVSESHVYRILRGVQWAET